MILVAGATGRLGRLLVGRLVARGLPVQILTRDPARADPLAHDLVTVIRGDVRDRQSLGRATAGVDVVVSAMHGFTDPHRNSLTAVDRDGNANLVEAARSAGAGFVLISTVGAAADSPMELFRAKHAAEQYAIASGVPTTIVRATAFLELWVELLVQTAGRSGRPLVFGNGENPINFVSVADVAALVDTAITDASTRGQILQIGGPANLTLNQLALAVQTAAGGPLAPRHLPRPVLRLTANTAGRIKPELGRQARAALAMDRTNLSFDATAIRARYPDLPCTSAADLLAGHRQSKLEAVGQSQPPTG